MPDSYQPNWNIGGGSEGEDAVEGDVAQRKLLIATWKARNQLYENIFGKYTHTSPENYAAPPALLEDSGANEPSEDQPLAILAYGPDPMRPYWIYLTAGLCSPWLQQAPAEVSGFGCELMIKSPVEAEWPAQVLRSMAFYIFNHAGTLSPGVRVGLNAPIIPNSSSKLRNLIIWYADEAPDCWYQLPAGGFGIFTAIGITDDELKFAESVEEYGTWCIQQILRQTGSAQVTDPSRESVMNRDDIGSLIISTTKFADQFRQSPTA